MTFLYDPTSTPRTERLAGIELAIDVPDDGRWHDVVLDLPQELLDPDATGRAPNKANLLVDAPPAVFGVVDLDDVRLLEWRGRTESATGVWIAADVVRSEVDREIELVTSHC